MDWNLEIIIAIYFLNIYANDWSQSNISFLDNLSKTEGLIS